jgi:hypothetical protein
VVRKRLIGSLMNPKKQFEPQRPQKKNQTLIPSLCSAAFVVRDWFFCRLLIFIG